MTVLRKVVDISVTLENGCTGQALTLRQLVPINESLLIAVSTSSTNGSSCNDLKLRSSSDETNDVTTSATLNQKMSNLPTEAEYQLQRGLDSSNEKEDADFRELSRSQLLKALTSLNLERNSDDFRLCNDIFMDPQSSFSRKLLVFQYLVFHVNDSLIRLSEIFLPLIPWLLLLVSEEKYCDVSFSTRDAPPSTHDFIEACLDAVFSPSSSWNLDSLQACLEQIMRVTIRSREHWTMNCLLLVRLQFLTTSGHGIMYKALIQYILMGLDLARSHLFPVEWILSSTHNDLLPLLHEQPNYMMSLWTYAWSRLSPPVNSNAGECAHLLLLQTAILCAVLPHLVSTDVSLLHESPDTKDDNHSQQAQASGRPIQSPKLWNLIHFCLLQGLYVTKKQSWIQESWANEKIASKEKRLPFGTAQLLRRRGLYLLEVLIEHSESSLNERDTTLWKKYLACSGTMEMERASHLVDQVWETIAELASQLQDEAASNLNVNYPPPMSWKWIHPLLARVITCNEAPSLRKLCLYRLFRGEAGVLLHVPSDDTSRSHSNAHYCSRQKKESHKNLKKWTKNRPSQVASGIAGAPISVVTSDFVVDIVLPAFDTLESAVGSQIHLEKDRKEVRYDMHELLGSFLDAYLINIDNVKCEAFFRGLWSSDLLCMLNRKTTVSILSSVATSLRLRPDFVIPTHCDMYIILLDTLLNLFSFGSLIPAQRESISESVAIMLSRCRAVQPETLSPFIMLRILSLFPVTSRDIFCSPVDEDLAGDEKLPIDDSSLYKTFFLERNQIFDLLRQWIYHVCCGTRSGWTSNTGAAIATAFIDGSLLTHETSEWDPYTGASAIEREVGRAVVLFCVLSCSSGTDNASETTPSSLLWPAIHKGLTSKVLRLLFPQNKWVQADVISRAIILMENGCKLQVTSGLGNGDLVVDRKTHEMMSPPPNIENLVGLAVSFLVHHFRHLFVITRSDPPLEEPKMLLSTFICLMTQLETLSNGYPSSPSIQQSMNDLLHDSLTQIANQKVSTAKDAVVCVTTIFAALASGVVVSDVDISTHCNDLLHMKYDDLLRQAAVKDDKAYRIVFEYAKWASIAKIMPRRFDSMTWMEIDAFVDTLVDEAVDSVASAPAEGLMPIFHCVLAATKFGLKSSRELQTTPENDFLRMEKLIQSIMRVIKDCKGSGKTAYMLDTAASLLFSPELLLDESDRFLSQRDTKTPLLIAFQEIVKMAGSKRHHILEAVLCRITVGWIGPCEQRNVAGIAAIPYLKEIATFLVYKEEKLEAPAIGQVDWRKDRIGNFSTLPSGTHESSVARGFLLQFISNLPDVDEGLSATVLTHLLNPLIYLLMDEVKPVKHVTVNLGSVDFIRKIRGWQALCVLSRFVTTETASDVCEHIFHCMSEILHGQIRFFIEVNAIQCSRKHPKVFGKAIVEQINRTDLSLQQVSSLMIVAGNLLVGRYRNDFFGQFKTEECVAGTASLELFLSGIIPWLGSTQSFSRAIAQLLAHRLIPMVIDISTPPAKGTGYCSNDCYLRSIYTFLDRNSDMKRLRSKQVNFFELYDADRACTTDGILSIPVDDGGEAFPAYAVEAIKESLRQVFQEPCEKIPTWKHLENIIDAQTTPSISKSSFITSNTDVSMESIVNFQRKIIPIDALNLALENVRELRQRNRAGRIKQKVIVCASFIDKIPNLGGLARTAEIFAAERLVIPDLRAIKTDNFKSLSVAAADWIDIEECKEENLLEWLRARKRDGYFIVGLEQTASSVSLSNFVFPDRPIVLLLGKEKEGIPVNYLQVVNQCVEIPQMGICRSLNVHVSGAVALWEQTRQSILNGRITDPTTQK